jgi:hypothetical protein
VSEEEFDTDDSAVLAAIAGHELDFSKFWYQAPPAPGFVHPYYARWRNMVEQWLDAGLFWDNPNSPSPALVVPIMNALTFDSFYGHGRLSENHTLLRREPRALGLCPYVGEPALYWWWTASDKYGRQVSGRLHREEVDYQAVVAARGKARFIL